MHVHSKGSDPRAKYLVCRRPGCRYNGKRYQYVEMAVAVALLQIDRPETRNIILSRIPDDDAGERTRLQETVDTYRAEVRVQEAKVDRWATMFESGEMTAGTLRDRAEGAEKALASARKKLAAAEDRLARMPDPDQVRADAVDFIDRRAAALAGRLKSRDYDEASRVRAELEAAQVMVSVYKEGVVVGVCSVPLDDLLSGLS
jgi:hypothetical protein